MGNWQGSIDNNFFYGTNNFDWLNCFWLSSSCDLYIHHGMVVGPDGMIDGNYGNHANVKQRPALFSIRQDDENHFAVLNTKVIKKKDIPKNVFSAYLKRINTGPLPI